MSDEILQDCNETELLQLARIQGLGFLRRGLPRATLIQIVTGEVEPAPDHMAETAGTRARLELFIAQHWKQIQSQLPGCNGKCTSYPCSEGRHLACFAPNADVIQ